VEPTISPGGPADRDAALALLEAQLAEHAIAIERGRLAAAIDGALADARRGRILLARDAAGAAIGVAYVSFVWALEHGGQAAWLEELYVTPAARGAGVGTRLLRAACTAAAAAGCAAIDLEVEATHRRVEALYAREGFRRHARARWVRPLDG
jgi:GNAT superfamily N-acetyltransferase